MKYYSEITKKYYDTEKECLKDENRSQIVKKENKLETTSKETNRKKELSDKIANADDKIKEAYSLLKITKEDVNKLLEQTNSKVRTMLSDAEEKVRQAEKEKYELISQFNKEFGTYNVCYTNAKAAELFEIALNRFDRMFRDLTLL